MSTYFKNEVTAQSSESSKLESESIKIAFSFADMIALSQAQHLLQKTHVYALPLLLAIWRGRKKHNAVQRHSSYDIISYALTPDLNKQIL